jgi:hypothetical protein
MVELLIDERLPSDHDIHRVDFDTGAPGTDASSPLNETLLDPLPIPDNGFGAS